MLAKSPRVFGMVSAVPNLSKNCFSKKDHLSIDPGFQRLNHVRALSNKVLGKALHNTASSFVTNLIFDLYLQMCSSGLDCLLYRMNCGILSDVFGATSWSHFVIGPNSMERDFLSWYDG